MSDSITAFESKDEFRYSKRLSFATTDAEEMYKSSGSNTSCYYCDKGVDMMRYTVWKKTVSLTGERTEWTRRTVNW